MSTRAPITGEIATDIAAREAHVVGDRLRIAPLTGADVSAEALELVNGVRKGAGAQPVVADAVPEYMRVVMKHPEIFRCQMDMGTVIYTGQIPARERELSILRSAWLTQSPYEWGEHVNIGKRFGLTDEEVARTRRGSSAPEWTEHERAVIRGTEELLADYALSDETWDTLSKSWSEAQLIEFPMMVGQYLATALVQNTLRIRLASTNPGLNHL